MKVGPGPHRYSESMEVLRDVREENNDVAEHMRPIIKISTRALKKIWSLGERRYGGDLKTRMIVWSEVSCCIG